MHSIERISEMERRYERVDEALQAFEKAVEAIVGLEDDIQKLDAYYSGDEWKADFEADERGLLPKELKRGVLAEDTLWDLLNRVDTIKQRIIDFSETKDGTIGY